MKKTSIEDFGQAQFQTPITASGQFYQGKYNVNLSSILTKLIQEAGRWCKSYASDLFIWWSVITRQMEDGALESGSYLFGFYETGVDDLRSILNQYKSNMAGFRYRSIWRLDITVNERESKFSLYEVQR